MLRSTLSIALLAAGCGAKTGLLVTPCPDGGNTVELRSGLDEDCDGAVDDGNTAFSSPPSVAGSSDARSGWHMG